MNKMEDQGVKVEQFQGKYVRAMLFGRPELDAVLQLVVSENSTMQGPVSQATI